MNAIDVGKPVAIDAGKKLVEKAAKRLTTSKSQVANVVVPKIANFLVPPEEITKKVNDVIEKYVDTSAINLNPLDAWRRLTDFSQTSYAAGSRLTY